MTITVLGTGFVGLTTATLFAHAGHKVYAVEPLRERLESVKSGRSFFYEEGLDPLIAEVVKNGRMIPTDSYNESVPESDVVISSVGTPDNPVQQPLFEDNQPVESGLEPEPEAGDTVLVHAAAGGMGLLLTQLATGLGARVIGTVSTTAKAQIAREAGAAEVIRYTEQDVVAEVHRITEGAGISRLGVRMTWWLRSSSSAFSAPSRRNARLRSQTLSGS
jgi:threonine dehydrogenase-like Zn-dependent dehydrogenase